MRATRRFAIAIAATMLLSTIAIAPVTAGSRDDQINLVNGVRGQRIEVCSGGDVVRGPVRYGRRATWPKTIDTLYRIRVVADRPCHGQVIDPLEFSAASAGHDFLFVTHPVVKRGVLRTHVDAYDDIESVPGTFAPETPLLSWLNVAGGPVDTWVSEPIGPAPAIDLEQPWYQDLVPGELRGPADLSVGGYQLWVTLPGSLAPLPAIARADVQPGTLLIAVVVGIRPRDVRIVLVPVADVIPG